MTSAVSEGPVTKGTRDWHDYAAGRRWSGLPLSLWRWARANGHALHTGERPGLPFSMNGGFHCPCGGWSVAHEDVTESGILSNVVQGYELWGGHVRAAHDAASQHVAL